MSTFIDEIKKIPITDYAERIGFELVKKGSRYVSLKEHDSVMIDTEKNAYWQNSEFTMGKKGGAGSVIDFAMNMKGLDLNAALRELATMYGIEGNRSATVQFKTPTYKKPSNEKKREAGDIELPPAAKNNDAVIKYLTEKRHINPQIVQSFIDRGLLYQDDKRNCVFHTDRFGCKRSTGEKRFAIDLKGNDYAECFYVPPQKKSVLNRTIIVTEAVIDQMSVMSFLADKRDYNAYCYLALTGTNKTASLFNALKRNPELTTVVLALDNDEAGRKATKEVMDELKERGINCVDYPAKEGKDWNEYISILAERESEKQVENVEESRQLDMSMMTGNPDFYRKFPQEQEEEIAAFQDKTGWKKAVTSIGEVFVYRSEQDLPDSVLEYIQTRDKRISEKLAAFKNETVKEIAQYFLDKGGNDGFILYAPDDVALETISAVTDAAANQEIDVQMSGTVYAAMELAEAWNNSNYQAQVEVGMQPAYRLDSEFMNRLPYSLCSFAANGKDSEYLLAVVTDYIEMEQENFEQDLDTFKNLQRGVEIGLVKPIETPNGNEVTHGEYTPHENIIFVALESTHDYSNGNFKPLDGQEQYRWITLTSDGTRVEPLNDMIFSNAADARFWRFNDDTAKAYTEKTYDELCDQAYYNDVMIRNTEKAKEADLVTAIKEKVEVIDKQNEALKKNKGIEIETPKSEIPEKVISVTGWGLEALQRFQQEYPIYDYHLVKGKIKGEVPPLTQENAKLKILVASPDDWKQFVTDRLAEVDYLQNPPTITCEWTESKHFEDGKTYGLAEFSDKMGEVDAAHYKGYREAMAFYQDDTTAFWNDVENGTSQYAEFATPYEKTSFTINIPNIGAYTDRQDIGDGDGTAITHLAQIESFKSLVKMLQEVAKYQREQQKEKREINDEKVEKANDIMEQSNTQRAVYVDGKPTWYAQIDEIRLNNSAYDINAELAERNGIESGRDAFADSPLDSVQENILVVAALTSYNAADLQMLSDAVKNGINTISLSLENGNEFSIDVKSKFIDMAKAYVSDMEKQQPEQEVVTSEPVAEIENTQESLPEEPESEPMIEAEPEQEAEPMKADDPITAEVTHGEEVTMADATAEIITAQAIEGGYDKSRMYTLEYRLHEIETLLEAAGKDKNLLTDEQKAQLMETKEQLVSLISKLGTDKADIVMLTPDETALTEETEKWLSEHKEQMDSKERVAFELTEGIKSVMQSENYKNWLDTNSKFFCNQYSFQNAMLVFLQNPTASYTMSYDKWKYYGRQVNKGEEGIRILRPKLAYEKGEGSLFRNIKNSLIKELAQNPNEIAKYQLGVSKLEFTMNSNHVIGLNIGGVERMVFNSDEMLKKFIDRDILGKVPVGYSPVSVFDITQTERAKEIFVKPSEMLPTETVINGEDGKPITNKRGEVKILVSEERYNRFRTEFPEAEQNGNKEKKVLTPEKVAVLYESLKAVNAEKNVPVYEKDKQDDEELKGGASGYFDRQSTNEHPNGYIVIQADMPLEEKLKVLFHETAHADLHGNLVKLADEMQLDKKELGRSMRETQAESVAYALGQEFGIETSTDSFAYLAAYSRGFELQELQKSMNVIHKEVQQLRRELAAELEARQYDIALNPIEKTVLTPTTVDEKTKHFVDFATEQVTKAASDKSDVPDMMQTYGGNESVVTIISDIEANCNSREFEANLILSCARSLADAKDRATQDMEISTAQNSMRRVNEANAEYETLIGKYMEVVRNENDLRKAFSKDKVGTLKKIAADYPRLAALSDVQLEYIAKSKICSKELKYLNTNLQKFVDNCCERAEQLPNIAAKNGAFIEVNKCEQWTNPAVFTAGTLCHPRIAEKIMSNAEKLIRGLKATEEAKGGYLPATRCELTAYCLVSGELKGLMTTIDIGDGEQNSLLHHFQQLAATDKKIAQLTATLETAIEERGKYAEKIYGHVFQEPTIANAHELPTTAQSQEQSQGLGLSKEEWNAEIQDERANAVVNNLMAALNQAMEQANTNHESQGQQQDSPDERE